MHTPVSFAALAALVSLVSVAPTAAAPITYIEQINGDLPAQSNLPVFVVDLGLNTFDGNTGMTPSSFDFDSFAFTVPAGLEVLTGKITLTDDTGDVLGAAWRLGSGSATYAGGTNLGVASVASPGFANLPATPLPAGTYNLSQIAVSINDGAGSTANADYTIIFDVHQIPEPTTLALAALGSLALVRRRRVSLPDIRA